MDRAYLDRAYIGLGTNLGDRIQNLIEARQRLSDLPATCCLANSSFYVSSPVGGLDQPHYVNAVVQLDYAGSAECLFSEMKKIEDFMGRIRDPSNRNAPRLIDLDLLAFGDLKIVGDALTLPHPRLSQRLFVVYPLLELCPELTLPDQGKLGEVLANGLAAGRFSGQIVHKLGG